MDYKTYDYNTNEQTIKTKQKYSVRESSFNMTGGGMKILRGGSENF